ncbi:MAG TPA: MAPEG family protein [Nostocaceae cyanobacterium]|nr:MAPEG family protein [Nostocaceae cyanobacterium]
MLLQLPLPNIFLYSIPAAAVLIYLPYIVVAYGRAQVGFDLAAPRALFEKLPDYAKRATWAHQNSFETFMIFAPGALMAYITGVNSTWGAIACVAFVAARALYSACYIFNIPILRSLMFGIGTFSSITLYYLSIIQVRA